jgi:putative ABC transport system permease protein
VGVNFFSAFDVPIVAGRAFIAADIAGASGRPVIVNRRFAQDILGGVEVLGRRIRPAGSDDGWSTIVGVVDDDLFPAGLIEPDATKAKVYHPMAPGEIQGALLMVHLQGQTPTVFGARLRQIALAVDPTLQLRRLRSLDAVYDARRRELLTVVLAVGLGLGSVLLLSAAGMYALMSFTVNQRRREIGVRAALGAGSRRILMSILSRAIRQLAIGVAVGLGLTMIVDRLSGGGLLNGTGVVLVPGIAAFMAIVGILAAAGPARRALRIQPTDALRAE